MYCKHQYFCAIKFSRWAEKKHIQGFLYLLCMNNTSMLAALQILSCFFIITARPNANHRPWHFSLFCNISCHFFKTRSLFREQNVFWVSLCLSWIFVKPLIKNMGYHTSVIYVCSLTEFASLGFECLVSGYVLSMPICCFYFKHQDFQYIF